MRKLALTAAIAVSGAIFTAPAFSSPWSAAIATARVTHTAVPPAERVNWFAFSPEAGGMDLVLYGVYSARTSLHVLAYLITYRPLLEALAEKARAGVAVTVVVDYGESIAKDRSGYIRRGLDFLQRSGVNVCAVDAYPLMHDKSMGIDGRSVQLGSINYTEAGAKSNSEDAVIEWNDTSSAAGFEQHFRSRLALCRPIS